MSLIQKPSALQRNRAIAIRSSASLVSNNLSVCSSPAKKLNQFAVIHKGTITVMSCSEDFSITNQKSIQVVGRGVSDMAMAFTAKWVDIGGRNIFVIAFDRGVQMFEGDGSVLLFTHAIKVDTNSELPALFMRGVCGLNEAVAVGLNNGSIFLFKVPIKGSSVSLSKTLVKHSLAISDLINFNNTLISADDSGKIIMWSDSYEPVCEATSCKFPVTAMAVWRSKILICGTGNGQVHTFDLTAKLEPLHQINAHAKVVTSVDVMDDMILSAGEDCCFNVFEVQNAAGGDGCEIAHKKSVHIPNSQLTGAKFLRAEGKEQVVVIGAEFNELAFFY